MPLGLSAGEAAARLARDGPNELPKSPPPSLLQRLARQFSSPLIYILLVALGFDLIAWLYEGRHGWPIESTAIAVILIFNAGLGVYQEWRSEAALEKLRELAAPRAWAYRDGQLVQIATTSIVCGDVVRLDEGGRVPADGRLLEPRDVLIDESVLTGESMPVGKDDGDLASSGTLIVRGQSLLEVTAIGQDSSMGRLAGSLRDVVSTGTPLERRLDQLGRRIAKWVLLAAATMAGAGVLAEGVSHAPEMVLFAVALAVAAVPEGLPAVLTVALALGVERMAQARAVVRRLAAVEALGSVTVIATDKTGTLTENRMEVESIDSSDEGQLLEAIVIANDADPSAGSGDPIDQGLLRFAAARGVDVAAVRRRRPERSRRAFDSRVKFSRTTVSGDQSGDVSYLKGAPEVLIARCRAADEQRRHWRQQAETRAREGFRVLAVARGSGEAENELEWLGLVSFWDPPRPEVPDAVARALAAGIRVVMITGDHPATALAVARRIGIPGDRVMTGDDLERHQGPVPATLDGVNVFARVRPEQKLAIVTALQEATHIVAMTGDGVNDAPALKRADIGVAMGQRGSEVSREVADLVLLDDNFATIVRAVEQGRGIYENVQKFLRFLFSTNLSEVLLIASGVLLAFALGLRDSAGALMLPLTAAQVLWINLMTDGLPAIALALDRTPGLMSQAPRPPQSPLLDVPSTRFIVSVGIMKAAVGLAVLGGIPLLGYDLVTTRTVTFHFMAIGQLVLTYSARHTATHPLSNPFLHAAVAGGIALQVAAGTWHSTSTLLGLSTMPPLLWGAVAVGALVVLGLAEVIASIAHRRSTRTISGPDGPESTPGNQQVTGSAA